MTLLLPGDLGIGTARVTQSQRKLPNRVVQKPRTWKDCLIPSGMALLSKAQQAPRFLITAESGQLCFMSSRWRPMASWDWFGAIAGWWWPMGKKLSYKLLPRLPASQPWRRQTARSPGCITKHTPHYRLPRADLSAFSLLTVNHSRSYGREARASLLQCPGQDGVHQVAAGCSRGGGRLCSVLHWTSDPL